MRLILPVLFAAWACVFCGVLSAQTNALTYLDEFLDPYYPGIDFPKLTTPQWIGEPGVDAVVTLGIDDMRDTAKYEAYLRPILDRLNAIDGRAAVSIMTCQVDPNDPQLQAWLAEGLSLETHTVDHPCPCLQGNDFAKAKSTYDRCVDVMFAIPGNQPVAFRFPCMDSKNTPSPRAFAEIVNTTTDKGNFLQASSSVECLFTSADPMLPKSITLNENGQERFRRYLPFPSFVNKVDNYPYPYVIGKTCWEFPCTVPDDWHGQNIQQPYNPKTVDDLVAAIDATVIKKGIANIVFHPHNWLRPDQMVTVIDRVNARYGKRVKFLTFKECVQRINQNLLSGHPIRSSAGGDNGVRILDLNQDGFLDVLIGNQQRQVARVWQPETNNWRDVEFASDSHGVQFVDNRESGDVVDLGVKFGRLSSRATVSLLVSNERERAIYDFIDGNFVRIALPSELSDVRTSVNGIDQGVRLRDLDGDGLSEIIVANPVTKRILKLGATGIWAERESPMLVAIVDDRGQDNGVRFVDLNHDGHDDLIVSNGEESSIHLYDSELGGFTPQNSDKPDLPLIVRDSKNNGVWFAEDHLWVQNEDTNRLPDGVDRRSFSQLLGEPDAQLDSAK
ncbi:FG-GAP-like repeat-containing protein [Rubripirellula reticaptiva]|uniref:FG-GAP repeat protein n=1 Tax=Rubripirellula reticaptiva TaxID=2528013 RepID=A0A5C6EU97_9BACT|nr:FG-GAP-like repeat-containing protein [Rubripirellula reticaptiva]TWU51964.1 FG-GAP repeat protein [Rubripirellula reticaptiva]